MSQFHDESRTDAWTLTLSDVLWRCGRDLQALDRTNPSPDERLLPRAMAGLFTELESAGFSQAEIRQAYEIAIAEKGHR